MEMGLAKTESLFSSLSLCSHSTVKFCLDVMDYCFTHQYLLNVKAEVGMSKV